MRTAWRQCFDWMERPRPGLRWRLAALWLGPLLLLLVTVLPAALLAGRLPSFEVPPYQRHRMSPVFAAWLAGPALAGAWTALMIAYLWLCRTGLARNQLWRFWLPLLYFCGGGAAAWSNTLVAINLDRPYALPPDAQGAAGLLIDSAAGLLAAVPAVLIGRRAADFDQMLRPRPVSRTIWISEVQPSATWWLIRGATLLAVVLVCVSLFGLAGDAGTGLAAGLVMGGFQALLVLLASTAQLVLTPDGIRVRYGHLGIVGSVTTMDQIESIEVTTVRLLKLRATWYGPAQLVLRDGPALLVHTRWGERRWFTLPEAQEAAALLRTWKEQRQTAVAAWYAPGRAT